MLANSFFIAVTHNLFRRTAKLSSFNLFAGRKGKGTYSLTCLTCAVGFYHNGTLGRLLLNNKYQISSVTYVSRRKHLGAYPYKTESIRNRAYKKSDAGENFAKHGQTNKRC